MSQVDRSFFNADIWRPALEKYGAVTRLTAAVYDENAQLVCGPVNGTALFDVLAEHQYDPGMFSKSAQRCLECAGVPKTFVNVHRSGLAVVCTALSLHGNVVGAAVAGYHLLEFPQAVAAERLAHEAHIAVARLWEIFRRELPVSRQRFVVQGELLQVLGDTILRDAYRARQYEEAAAALQIAAAAKDEFLAVLSHELRTPLSPILGWARMLRLGDDPARIERAAEVIERNTLLQTRLVDDLLELTRVTRGKIVLDLRTSDLGEALRSALDASGDAAKHKQVHLKFLEAAEPLLVRADVNRLQQIFRNVLSNALKFTPSGGQVTVSLTKDTNMAVTTIRDTGEGIEPQFLPLVFDIFQQQEQGTRRKHEGLGIGLALVKHLTELQGGRVTVASEGTGHGTEVTIEFPLLAEPTDTMLRLPSVRRTLGQELQGLYLLLVEDVDDTREATQLMLERLGAHVVVAKDGVEALEMVAAATPDIVLCDLRMPRMDGFEFIRAFHDRCGTSCPPVIAISGFSSRADHVRTEEAGFEAHLDKPFDDAGLVAVVSAAMARHRHS